MSGDNDSGSEGVAAEPLNWELRLWKQQPGRRIVVFVCAGVAGLFGWFLFQNALLALVGVLVILGSTTEFWLPLRYTVDAKGARVRSGISVTAIDWEDVKRVTLSEDGLKISPLAAPGRTAVFRGVYLRFGENQEEVVNQVRRFWSGEIGVLGERAIGGETEGVDSQGGESGDQEGA